MTVTFNYRGSWGSPGNFRFTQTLEDAAAVLAYLRDATNAAALGIDTRRIALVGHSMGGWVVAHTAARDHDLIGAALISAADIGGSGSLPRDRLATIMSDKMETLVGVTAESMADEIRSNAATFRMVTAAEGLSKMPLLALTADDGLAGNTDALVRAIRLKGSDQVTTMHFA